MKMDPLHISHELLKHPFLNFPSVLQHSNANYPGNIIFKLTSDGATAVGSNPVEPLRKIIHLSIFDGYIEYTFYSVPEERSCHGYRGGAGFYYKISVLVDTIQYTLSKTFICVHTFGKTYAS
jgi:hypothetical protein